MILQKGVKMRNFLLEEMRNSVASFLRLITVLSQALGNRHEEQAWSN